jgi:glyoxylase-like metal-dependent hydrolase (beta-lactamase superfamily II)
VNTHADWDHAWGNQIFAGPDAVLRAPIVGTRRCGERLRSPEARQRLAEMQVREPGRFDDVRLIAPTILLDRGLVIDGGDLTLELFATPGHTADHLSVFIPEIQTLLAGDAAEMPLPFVDGADNIPIMRDSLRQMAARNPGVALYCHAPVSIGPSLLRTNLAYFDELERRCRRALARDVATQPAADDAIEALIAFPFEEVVPTGVDAEPLAGFYRPAHHAAARAMLDYCEKNPAERV